MSDRYQLPVRKARICRIAGALFVFFAICQILAAALVAAWPGPSLRCDEARCAWVSEPVRMLEEDEQAKIAATPGAERALALHVDRPIVRMGILGATLIDAVPFALLLLGVGLALRRLGRRGDDPFGSALPWLRRASLAAIVWALARPLSGSLMAALLSPGTPSGGHWYINVDFVEVGTALMLGIAAYATVWALEAGLRARRDLDEFV